MLLGKLLFLQASFSWLRHCVTQKSSSKGFAIFWCLAINININIVWVYTSLFRDSLIYMSHRSMRTSASVGADVCVGRCVCPRRSMRMSASVDAYVCVGRRGWCLHIKKGSVSRTMHGSACATNHFRCLVDSIYCCLLECNNCISTILFRHYN